VGGVLVTVVGVVVVGVVVFELVVGFEVVGVVLEVVVFSEEPQAVVNASEAMAAPPIIILASLRNRRRDTGCDFGVTFSLP
jgi:hypothetical protein